MSESGSESEIRRLVAALDEDADILHNDVTPAVRKLPQFGTAVIPHLRDALLSDNWETRMHAQAVLATVVGDHVDDAERAKALWRDNGAYDAQAEPEARQRSVQAWMSWYRENHSGLS